MDNKTKNEKGIKLQEGEYLPPLVPEGHEVNMIAFAEWYRAVLREVGKQAYEDQETDEYYAELEIA